MKNYKLVEDGTVKVYEHIRTKNIKCIYPKASKWAQKIALEIYYDAELNGFPTEKGKKDIVQGLWAKMIQDGVK